MSIDVMLSREEISFRNGDLWERYIVPTMSADLICAEGITEPLKGSDIARLQTVAKKDCLCGHLPCSLPDPSRWAAEDNQRKSLLRLPVMRRRMSARGNHDQRYCSTSPLVG